MGVRYGRRGECSRTKWSAALGLGLGTVLLAWCPCGFALDPALDVSRYAHTSWKIRDGFTQGYITSIAQTPDGYLWLGTQFGVVRFDGVRAVPWQLPAGQRLPDDFVYSLLVSHDGTLWIGTRSGLASWSGGTLIQYPQLAGSAINSLLEDREGTVWVAGAPLESSAPQPMLCAFQRGRIQCHGNGGFFQQALLSLYEDTKGNLWVGSLDGLWRWKPGLPQHYKTSSTFSITEDENGALVLGGREGLQRLLRAKSENYALPGVSADFTVYLFRSSEGSLWVGTAHHGLVHIHRGRTDRFEQADGLSGRCVIAIFEDHEGNIWVSTNGGLDRFRDFTVPPLSNNQGLANPASSLLAANDGSIWVAHADGLSRWKDGRVTIYSSPGKLSSVAGSARTAVTETEVVSNSGLPDAVQSLFQDHVGQIWAATSKGVVRWDGSRFVPVNGIPTTDASAIAEDPKGTVWISSGVQAAWEVGQEGLFRVPRQGDVNKIPWSQLGRGGYATAMAVDPLDGGLWLAFARGGITYWKDGRLRASYTAKDGLGNGVIRQLRLGRDGALWAATEGGLSRVRDGQVATLTSKNGLPCDAVLWSVEDDYGSIWLCMPCGLARLAQSELDVWVSNPKQIVQTTAYDVSDGVSVTPVYSWYRSPRVAKSTDGKIWFLTNDGVSVIDPQHLPYNRVPPPVHIEQITADRKTYDAASYEMGGLRLPPLVGDLTIDYTALSFVAPEKVLFRYKLEGLDRDWQDVGNRRQAFYTKLSPGNYRFRVAACNNSGVWNEAGTFLDFSVPPAYYQTNWFRVTCVAAFLVFLWGLHRLRLRQVAREFNMGLEARVSERTRIARDMHDTLLQSFHGLLLRFQAVSNLLPAGEPKQKLDSAIDQAAQAITEGRDAVQGLRTSTVETNDLALALNTLGEELAGSEINPNSAEFHVAVEGTPRNLHPILRDEVYRITGEALRNAFKHAQAQRIEVEIRYDERQLRLRVRDDGKGINPKVLSGDGRAGHFGLHGMRERAGLLGGKLAVWSELDSGTEVELSIPASHAYETSTARRRSWLAKKFSGKTRR